MVKLQDLFGYIPDSMFSKILVDIWSFYLVKIFIRNSTYNAYAYAYAYVDASAYAYAFRKLDLVESLLYFRTVFTHFETIYR